MCAYDFSKHKDKHSETESKLKIPIVNNMALSFMMLATQELSSKASHLERANGLLDQVLKSDPKNEKALLRKCGVLVDLNCLKECEEILEKLNLIAFDSANSQAVYMEIKRIKQRIEDIRNPKKEIPNVVLSQQPKKNGFDKENDWYYQKKQFEEQYQLIKKA